MFIYFFEQRRYTPYVYHIKYFKKNTKRIRDASPSVVYSIKEDRPGVDLLNITCRKLHLNQYITFD
jgi:hypothetical protein